MCRNEIPKSWLSMKAIYTIIYFKIKHEQNFIYSELTDASILPIRNKWMNTTYMGMRNIHR